ncbi:MAG: hypothetical protein AAB869_00135, partial [Patescibacteria group bacterium]
ADIVSTLHKRKFLKFLGENFKTPKEAFENELKKIEMKKSAVGGIIKSNIKLSESVRIEGFF